MKQDDIWDFYISVAYRFLQVEQANTEETVSTLKSDADEIQNLGDRIESLLSEWHALHKPVKLPATWASVPSDIAALVDDHNARVSKVEKSLKDGSLALDSLAKLLGSKAQRDRVSRKIADMERTVKELRQLLITLYRGGRRRQSVSGPVPPPVCLPPENQLSRRWRRPRPENVCRSLSY